MTAFLKLYPVSLVLFLALDAVWLGPITRNFYRARMGRGRLGVA